MLQWIHANSFCSRTIRLWNPLPAECFLLTYDKSGIHLHNSDFEFNNSNFPDVSLCLHLSLETPYLAVFSQPYM